MSHSPSSPAPDSADTVSSPAPSPNSATTHWSAVLSAGRNDTPRARHALAALCQTYWPALHAYVRRRGFPPQDAEDLTQEFFARLLQHNWVALHAYVRRRGFPPQDAEDLTQEFFARLLQHNWVARADASKGRFRTFLLTALSRFLAGEWDKTRALKRGGGRPPLPLDSSAGGPGDPADAACALPPAPGLRPPLGAGLAQRTLSRLRAEFAQAGKAREFVDLKPFLTVARAEICNAQAAAAAGLSEGAARVAVHRLRRRYRELFREEIARTVADPADVDAELRHLIAVLAAR